MSREHGSCGSTCGSTCVLCQESTYPERPKFRGFFQCRQLRLVLVSHPMAVSGELCESLVPDEVSPWCRLVRNIRLVFGYGHKSCLRNIRLVFGYGHKQEWNPDFRLESEFRRRAFTRVYRNSRRWRTTLAVNAGEN